MTGWRGLSLIPYVSEGCLTRPTHSGRAVAGERFSPDSRVSRPYSGFKQSPYVDPKYPTESHDRAQAHVLGALLDALKLSSRDSGLFGRLLLRKVEPRSLSSRSTSQTPSEFGLVGYRRHTMTLESLNSYGHGLNVVYASKHGGIEMPQKVVTQPTIEALIDRAADQFSASLRVFKPWHRTNGITERNLSFAFATAFLKHFPDGLAFLEVPFTFRDRRRADTHLDAYLFATQLEILLECKTVFAKEHIDSIVLDMARMSPSMFQQIQERHRDAGARQAKDTVTLILADTWRLENAEWWCGAAAKKPRWSRDLLPKEGWTYGSRLVFKEHDGAEGSLFWLWAYKRLGV